jgi:hypothetical protein
VTPPPVPIHPHVAALESLRDLLSAKMMVNRVLVGGWEISPQRDVTIAVYTHEGSFSPKPGNFTRASTDSLFIVVNIRGQQSVTEAQMYPLRDAIAALVGTFSHDAVAGIMVTDWKFDILGNNTFDNVLTLTGKISFKSFQPVYPNGDPLVENTGFALSVILDSIQQEEIP